MVGGGHPCWGLHGYSRASGSRRSFQIIASGLHALAGLWVYVSCCRVPEPASRAREAGFVHVDAPGTDDHKRATGVGELGDMLDLPLRLAHDARKADVTPLTPEVDGAADTRV